MFRDTQSVFERLVCNSVSEPGPLKTQCWVWQKGCCNKGYGFLYAYDPDAVGTRGGAGKSKGRSKPLRAHIASYVLAYGLIEAGLTLDHLCRNTKCIRPSHLEAVSRPENTRRGNAARKRHTRNTATGVRA